MTFPLRRFAEAFLVTVPGGLALVERDAPGVSLDIQLTQDGGTYGIGTVVVHAEQAGNPLWNAAPPVEQAFTVGYGIATLFDGTRAAKAGSTLPVKLRLTDAAGADLSSASLVVTAIRLELVSSAASIAVQDSGNANPDGNFRFDASLGTSGGYIFNLSTKGLVTGTYDLVFMVSGDPAPHAVTFQVR